MASMLNKTTVSSSVLPSIQQLVTDASEHVRASLASVINNLATSLGKDDTVERLLPIILLLLRDEVSEVSCCIRFIVSIYVFYLRISLCLSMCSISVSDLHLFHALCIAYAASPSYIIYNIAYQVRLNIISNLEAINAVVSVELLSQSLLPAIVDLAEDGKWRVRLAIIELIPVLAKQLGKEYFGEKLSALCLGWLDDTVYSIRRAATENLLSLTGLFGEGWAAEYAIPRIERMCGYKNYLRRTTALYALQVIIRSLSAKIIEKSILPLVLQLTTDPVPNIRFVAAKSLQLIAVRLADRSCGQASARTSEDISTSLAKLLVDSDRDVKFYATEVHNITECIVMICDSCLCLLFSSTSCTLLAKS